MKHENFDKNITEGSEIELNLTLHDEAALKMCLMQSKGPMQQYVLHI